MGILLLCISTIFSFIFFLFSQEKISFFFGGPFFIESLLFLLLGVVFFFIFSGFQIPKGDYFSSFNFENTALFLKSFFQKYLYYIGCTFFYTSFYFILTSFQIIDISIIILIVNTVSIILFFLSNRFFITQDFIKINTILFSVYYIYLFIFFLYVGKDGFDIVDICNSVILVINFIFSLKFEKISSKKSYIDPIIYSYFLFYLLCLFIFYGSYIFNSLFFIITVIGISLCFIIFFLSGYFNYLKSVKFISRSLALCFLYIGSFAGMIFLLGEDFSFLVFLLLCISSIFNLYIHTQYQNYISLFFSLALFFSIFSYVFFSLFYLGEQKNTYFIVTYMLFAYSIILSTFIFPLKYYIDYYFFHIFAYIVNIFGVFTFFYYDGFNLLLLGTIFFLESIFVFLSYYKINTLQKNIGSR